MTDEFDARKARASTWFRDLRDQIVAAFEGLEDSQSAGPCAGLPAGRFEVRETRRDSADGSDAGGGLMSVMRGGVQRIARSKPYWVARAQREIRSPTGIFCCGWYHERRWS